MAIDLTKERADIQAAYTPAPWTGCESQYEMNEGLLVIPILGEPGDAPVIARVHSPYTTRTSAFNYVKGNAPPLVPSPGDTRSGHTFLSGNLTVKAPGNSGDGSLMYGAAGKYNFVLPIHAPTSNKSIMFDAWPYPTGVDELEATVSQGMDNPADPDYGQYYNTWKLQYFDLSLLSSFRILG